MNDREWDEPQAAIMEAIRGLMARHAPGASEVISRGSPPGGAAT